MAYLAPQYGPDVFVSYSHGDPRGSGGAPLKLWTLALVQRLEREILSLEPEFHDLQIWRDEQIDPTLHLTEELRGKVGACGVLIIVMSKHYLGSSWCRDELDWFRKQIQDRGADGGRVFVIRAQQTDVALWPDFLRDERGHGMPGFAFYDPATGVPWGWPNLQYASQEFVKEFCRLQIVLTKRLRELRDRGDKSPKAAAAPAPAQARGPRRIYLHATPEAEPARADIDRELKGDGIVPLTTPSSGGGLGGWQRDAGKRMETAKRCEALALLRIDDGDRFAGELLDIGVDERQRIADARGAPMPCAVLDKTGEDLPFDVSPWGIARFDVNRADWRGAFRQWLDASRAPQPSAAP